MSEERKKPAFEAIKAIENAFEDFIARWGCGQYTLNAKDGSINFFLTLPDLSHASDKFEGWLGAGLADASGIAVKIVCLDDAPQYYSGEFDLDPSAYPRRDGSFYGSKLFAGMSQRAWQPAGTLGLAGEILPTARRWKTPVLNKKTLCGRVSKSWLLWNSDMPFPPELAIAIQEAVAAPKKNRGELLCARALRELAGISIQKEPGPFDIPSSGPKPVEYGEDGRLRHASKADVEAEEAARLKEETNDAYMAMHSATYSFPVHDPEHIAKVERRLSLRLREQERQSCAKKSPTPKA